MSRKLSAKEKAARRPFMVVLLPEHQRALKTVAIELGVRRTDAFRTVIVNVAAEMLKQKQTPNGSRQQAAEAGNEQSTAA